MKLSRYIFVLIVLSLVGISLTSVALAQATTTTTNVKVPLNMSVFVPCANGGTGEVVTLNGTLHILTHTTVDNNGGVHLKAHFQPQGLSGVGLTTGDKYQGVGVTQDQGNFKVGSTRTFVNNFRMIGQGPGNNFMVHQNVHITVNANGEVTATVDNSRTTCK